MEPGLREEQKLREGKVAAVKTGHARYPNMRNDLRR